MKILLFLILIFSAGLWFLLFSVTPVRAATFTNTFSVVAGPDDVFRWGASTFSDSAIAFDFGNIAGGPGPHSAARFININIPPGSTISSAYLTLTARAANSSPGVNVKIYAENVANADRLDNANEFDNAALTNGTNWNNVSAFTPEGTPYNTPDISAEIQAVVNRPGWQSGNAINIFVKDNGSIAGSQRLTASRDSTYTEPRLTITWTEPGGNVSGYAWSENIGWISFNCVNTGSCATVDYGVNISASGNFFGYAWSENIGWINFNPDPDFVTYPGNGYPSSPYYPACLDLPGAGEACDGIGNYEVGGWARAVFYGGGWDGWLKLRGIALDGSPYGVSVDSTGSDAGDFSGWAWGSDVVGWISFSHINCDTDGNGFSNGGTGCPPAGTQISDYKVKTTLILNERPDKPMQMPVNWDNCTFKERSNPIFHWQYSDPESNPMQSYQFEVDEDAAFGIPMFTRSVNLVVPSPFTVGYILTEQEFPRDDDIIIDGTLNLGDLPPSMEDYKLDWNTNYFWRVRVRDSVGNWSEWSNSFLFRTPDHAYPWVSPSFSWIPAELTQKETVEFDPLDSQDFDGDPIPPNYLWTVTLGTGTFVDGTTAASQYPLIQFTTRDNTVSLQLTDSDSFSCTKVRAVTAQLPLPEYKEIPPIIWLKKIFAGLSTLWSWL